MKTVRFVFYFVLALIVAVPIATAQKTSKKTFVEDELLVKYKSGTASEAARLINASFGATVLEEFPDLGWQRVKLPDNLSVSRALADYRNSSEIEAVQPNFYYQLLATPNDSGFGSLYGMTKINAPAAWDLTTGSSAVVVADIDTGLRYTHEDLAANAWTNAGEIAGNGIDDDGNGFVDDVYGWDFFYNDSNPIDDAGGHGTHTAGTIGAVGNNAKGVVGVNWNVKIMPVKIFSPAGTNSTSAMIINAYNYIRMMKNRGDNIRVTSNSYGGCGEACGYDQATKDALDALGNAGVLNVFAAGNDGSNIDSFPYPSSSAPGYPARYDSPSILAVANSTSTDTRNGSSNYGAASVDLAAPGTGILSTYAGSDTSYASLTGTSMACPHVAGAAALLSAYNPNLSAASLKATLMNSVDVLADWNGIVKTGGRLNVSRALQNQTVCNFDLSQNQFSINRFGGNFTVSVAAGTNCDYSAISNASWITVTGGNPGSGSGTVSFSIEPNSAALRTGAINIGGKILTINQQGPSLTTSASRVLDFDGDGRTDFSAIQNNGGAMIWHNLHSTGGYAPISFGSFADDVSAANDYDGDGKTDVGVWRNSNGTFYVLRSSNATFQAFQFGQAGDNPLVSQDFDGDQKADYAVTRPVGGNLLWYISGSTAGFRAVQFGIASDKPLRGDFDGDGKADLAVYRAASNTFFVKKSLNNEEIGFAFGNAATDRIVPADFDGDGKTDFAVWRATNGGWYFVRSSNGTIGATPFGTSGDLPTPGDYDGDGKTDFAVWRPNIGASDAGVFYIQGSQNGFSAFGWGNSQMKIPANTVLGQ